jgi:hypothetical protein
MLRSGANWTLESEQFCHWNFQAVGNPVQSLKRGRIPATFDEAEKGETGWRECYAGWCAHTHKWNRLRTAGRIVRNAYRGIPGSGNCVCESHTDLAAAVLRNGAGTVVGLGKITPVGSINPD